jgi:cell division inhibitor SepF
MKIFDDLLRMIGLRSEDDDFEFEEQGNNVVPMFGDRNWEEEKQRESRKERPLFGKNRENDKLISMPLAKNQVSVVVIEPVNFDEVQKIADYLRKNQPVVINFEATDMDVRKRIVDFISGTIYALDGTMKKVGRNTMVCAPTNVDIDVENSKYAEEGGTAPWEQ